MNVGVIERGKYGSRLIDTIKRHSNFDVSSIIVQKELPPLIDDPESYIKEKEEWIFKDSDLIISFALHPDLTIYIAELCVKHDAELLIPGEEALWYADRSVLIREIGNTKVTFAFPRTMCTLGDKKSHALGEYSKLFGIPMFKCEVRDDKVVSCEATRSAPCGASYFVAEEIVGSFVDEAPCKAALLAQYYPCRAPRGYNYLANEVEGIHVAAEIHKKAMEKAIRWTR